MKSLSQLGVQTGQLMFGRLRAVTSSTGLVATMAQSMRLPYIRSLISLHLQALIRQCGLENWVLNQFDV